MVDKDFYHCSISDICLCSKSLRSKVCPPQTMFGHLAPFSLTLNVSRDGASTTSLGNLIWGIKTSSFLLHKCFPIFLVMFVPIVVLERLYINSFDVQEVIKLNCLPTLIFFLTNIFIWCWVVFCCCCCFSHS